MKKIILASLLLGMSVSSFAQTVFTCGPFTTLHGGATTNDKAFWLVVGDSGVNLKEMLWIESRNPFVQTMPMKRIGDFGANCQQYQADGITAKICGTSVSSANQAQSAVIEISNSSTFAVCRP